MTTIPTARVIQMPGGGEEMRSFRVDVNLVMKEMGLSNHQMLKQGREIAYRLLYGANLPENAEVVAAMNRVVDQFLEGAEPADLKRNLTTRISLSDA